MTSSRYDDLRQMREAKFATPITKPVTKTPATKPPVADATKPPNATKPTGRPLLGARPMTSTERSRRRYRARTKTSATMASSQ
jgi:hypothetical protein